MIATAVSYEIQRNEKFKTKIILKKILKKKMQKLFNIFFNNYHKKMSDLCRSVARVIHSLAPLTLTGATALLSCYMANYGTVQFQSNLAYQYVRK